MTRWSEKTASAAVSGLPEANFCPGLILKVKGFSVVAQSIAFSSAGHELGNISGLKPHDPVIDIGDDLDPGELIGFGRVEGNDIVDIFRNNQSVGRRCRHGAWRKQKQYARKQRVPNSV